MIHSYTVQVKGVFAEGGEETFVGFVDYGGWPFVKVDSLSNATPFGKLSDGTLRHFNHVVDKLQKSPTAKIESIKGLPEKDVTGWTVSLIEIAGDDLTSAKIELVQSVTVNI